MTHVHGDLSYPWEELPTAIDMFFFIKGTTVFEPFGLPWNIEMRPVDFPEKNPKWYLYSMVNATNKSIVPSIMNCTNFMELLI